MIPLTIQDQFYTIQNLQRSPIPQTSNWSRTFFCRFLQQTGSRLYSIYIYNYKLKGYGFKPILFQIPYIAYNTHPVNLGRKELTGMSSWYRFSFWSAAFRPFFHCSKSAKANVSISAYLQLTWVVQTNLSLYASLARFTRQTTHTIHFDRKYVLLWVFQGSVQEYAMNGRLKLLSKSMHWQIWVFHNACQMILAND